MNSYSLRSLQFRFSFVHLLVVLGVVLGSMVASYMMGFTSGQSIGLENALAISANQVTKLPIVSSVLEDEITTNLAKGGNNDVIDRNVKDLKNTSQKIADKDALKDINKKNEIVRLDPLARLENSKSDLFKIEGLTNGNTKNEDSLNKAQLEKKLKEEKIEDLSQIPVIKSDEVIPIEPSEAMKNAETLAMNKKNDLNEEVVNHSQGDLEQSTGYWYVQLVTTKSKEDVTLLTRKLRDSGFEVYSSTEKTSKGVELYKVYAGPEKKKELAERLLSQLKREKYIRVEPVLKKLTTPLSN